MMDMMTRRDFVKAGSITAASLAAFPAIASADGAGKTVTIALIGCGGRGKGALRNILEAAKIVGCNIKVAAFCDWFKDIAEKTRDDFNMPEAKVFYGGTGYKEVMAMKEVQAVLLVAPIGFRPLHFKAAVEAGKHVFEEKAVAVDGPGARMHLEAAKLSVEKHLTVVAGTQRRHYKPYRIQARALEAGEIAPICSGIVRWNTKARRVYMRDPLKDTTNKDYFIKNWNNFDFFAGDHIVEQHVHNIDIANWFIGRYPKKAVSFGMRARALTGNQYDFFSTELDYGDDLFIHSQCRQIDGCYGGVNEWFRTEKNEIISGGFSIKRDKKIVDLSKFGAGLMEGTPYVVEHVDFLKSLLGIGSYWNEAEQVTMSTASGIISNLSAKSGQVVMMNDLFKNENSQFYKLQFKPTALDFEGSGDVDLPEYGDDEFQLPGEVALPRPRNPEDDEWMPQQGQKKA